ncbi:MAG: SDR family NAD(P)-dependent oxidoreductase [Solirubrobacterales bacterium]
MSDEKKPGAGRVAGKTVVLTGAAQGQGAAEAELLVREGADVIAVDVRDELGERLVEELGKEEGGTILFRHLDVTSPDDWRGLVDMLESTGRRVDGLVNNAGLNQRSRLHEVTLEDWNRSIAVNLTGPMLAVQNLLPLMGKGSSIVNVGSVAALNAHPTPAYSAAKWGLRGLSLITAAEYGPLGIRTNIIHPGYIDTKMAAAAPSAYTKAHLDLTPLGRAGSPAEVAPLVLFLLSDESSYVNGTEIPIDGGYASHGGSKMVVDLLPAPPGTEFADDEGGTS